MRKTFLTLSALTLLAATPSLADDITDVLQSAMDAYEEGDVQYALDELEIAKQKLLDLKTNALGAYLPPAPDGWTREDNPEAAAGMGMMGGGVAAEATYSDGTTRYTINMMADNAMVASLAGIINNAGVMGLRMERVNRQKFAVQDNEIMGLVANRILVRISGADVDTMLAALGEIDFRAMAGFGS